LVAAGCLILGAVASADQNPYEESLPIGLTEDELTRLHEIGRNHAVTSPPAGQLRNCSEWEPSEGVIIRYPMGIPVSLVREMAEDVMVTVIVSSSYYANQATNTFTSGGVNMDNVQFFYASTDSWWTRDYGPWFIFEDKTMAIVDHIYNRPRPNDNLIPSQLGAAWGMDVYGMPLIHTGGNHMSDGLGMSMSTMLVYNENPSLSHDSVDSIMEAYLGNDYTVLGYIESGGIHHIDCWAKFLNPTTIIVKEVAPSHPSYSLLNARCNYLEQQLSPWGRPYTIVRVYAPNNEPYTNSLILNNKVFVPLYGTAWDANALATYQAAMPGYEIIGFTGSWLTDDAIHCRTMGVPDREMLFVDHIPLFDTEDTVSQYRVAARVDACSGDMLIVDSCKLIYRVDGASWQSVLAPPTAFQDSVIGYIPQQPAGSQIEYYIQIADLSGRLETHPYIGAPWAHTFQILATNIAPQIVCVDSIWLWSGEQLAFCPEIIDPDDTLHTVTYTGHPAWTTIESDSLVGQAPTIKEQTVFNVQVSDGTDQVAKDVSLSVYICGDIDDSGDGPNVSDLTYLVAYLFNDGNPPAVIMSADVGGDQQVNIQDLTYLTAFLFSAGPAPACAPMY
jgi:agmatine/peptidylarginine deiminase